MQYLPTEEEVHNKIIGHITGNGQVRSYDSMDELKERVAQERARIYKVARYYRPTLGQYKRLLEYLEGVISLYDIDKVATEHLVSEIKLDKLNLAIFKFNAIMPMDIRFRLGKFVFLK
jgi:hypothetical protein